MRRVLGTARWPRTGYLALCRLRSLPIIIGGLFTVAYFAATCWLASQRPFSFDELTTYHIARLPTAMDVWSAWIEAGDGMPPLVHLATHAVGSTLGFSHVTVRLPAMVGFWLMCLCLFVYLGRRRVGPMLATVGMLLPLTTPLAYSYAYEARGYGMVLGFSAAAVVCWDLVHTARWRRLALPGLTVFLAAAIGSHLYAVVILVPLALGELVRTTQRRRVDWFVWVALLVAGLVFLPPNPLLSHIRRLPELARYSSGPGVAVSRLMEIWPQFLSISTTYLGLLALTCLGRQSVPVPGDSPPGTADERLAPHDWVLVVGLMALPAVGWLGANLVTGLFLFRYVLATIIGFSLAIPLLCHGALRRRPEIALLMVGWVIATAAGSIMSSRRTMFTTTQIAAGRGCFRLLEVGDHLPQGDLPIVISDFNLFMQLGYYASGSLKQRLVFVVDPEFGALITPQMPFYGRVFGQHMEMLEPFLRSNASFYLYDCGDPGGRLPMVTRLLLAGASFHDSGLPATRHILLRRDLYRVSIGTIQPSAQHPGGLSRAAVGPVVHRRVPDRRPA
jgi:hypothetical protein